MYVVTAHNFFPLLEHAESNAFTTVFLTTFRTFTTANRLFELLTERFNMKIPKSLTEQEEKDWKVNLRDPVRRRILEVLRLWLVNYRLLEEEPHIAKRLTDFLCTIGEPHMSTAGKLIKDVERLVRFCTDISAHAMTLTPLDRLFWFRTNCHWPFRRKKQRNPRLTRMIC